MRDRSLGSTVRLFFNSTNPDAGGAPVAPSSAFAAADIRIYKDGSATEKTSTNGITVTSPFDSIVGQHLVEIDTSNNTGDSGFWASGSVYQVRLVTAKTVATYSVSGLPIGEFSLEVQTADVRKFGGTAGTFTSGKPTVELDSASRLAIWNTLTTETFTADSFGDLLLISDGTNGRAVKVTGANHVAADIHDCQADGLTASTEIAAVNTFAARVTTGLVLDGAVYQFTANMLELAPAGGGGGGSGDATLAKQEEILTQLDVIQTKTDQIGSVGAITSLLAAAVLEPGTITSFPETLTIGDSYTDQNGRSIQIPIVDTDGNPISSTGSLNFADASVTFTLQRSGETDSTRVITGTASFVDPPGTGTGAGAPYAVVEISSTETAKGLKKYKYSGILTFTWSGTGTDVMSFETSTVVFDN